MALQTELLSLIPALRRFAFSLTNSHADADDLVQNTLERVLKAPAPENVALIRWAFRICRNVWIDEYRARKARQRAAELPESLTELQQRHTTDGEQELAVRLDSVGKAMQKLPPEQHEVLSLVAVQGCSYKEAAQTLDIPVGTVMSRLARARAALVVLLADENGPLQTLQQVTTYKGVH
ncbi:RNA polymerase sigma factor [Aliidiomarina soli]|uniref:RNA polymerase subunit sigma-70 n=1 Tax=Aliidiomarina soli TaxID=1928574 RepID=A0A432WE01_9GAMM|nr:RNA polymerase sigma factor [Aliidiomarina soli]RUO31123.1 RNA polymerase subunit sigma-70 [Aliidiomarina soli]